MKNKKKIKKGNVIKTSFELAPYAMSLFNPEIISDPQKVIAGVLVNMVTYLTKKLFSEYKQKTKKGVLKKVDKISTEKPILTFIDLLKIINEGKIEEERFIAMKSIFFSGISKNSTQHDEILAYEFLQTTKKLSSTEILILKANFEIAQGNISKAVPKEQMKNGESHRSTWQRIIAKQMGYGDLYSIVAKYELNLESLGLISHRQEKDGLQGSFEPTGKNFRLTEMGYKFCEFMTKYE